MAKILFVEDDEFIAEIYMRKFQEAGFEVKNVSTGKAVLQAVKDGQYDLVMLDLVIPELSGMEVLRELKENPEYPKGVRVIVFSNLSSEEDRAQCISLGADGFISKTAYAPSEVVTEVNRFLRQFSEQGKNQGPAVGEETIGNAEMFSKKRILFIEDEQAFIDTFSRRLKKEGYEVVVREDGIQGLATATQEEFDLIISDVMMPGMQGHEMVEKLRATEGEKHVPIFLLSASMEESQFKELETANIVHKVFMKIHLTPTDLVNEVNSFFAQQGGA